jgi:CAAX protease family protein
VDRLAPLAMAGPSQRVGDNAFHLSSSESMGSVRCIYKTEMQDVAISSRTSSRNFILIAGLLLYGGAFGILLGNKSFEPAAAVFVLVVFGIALPLIAWLTTRHAVPLSISVRSGAPELIVLIAYVVAVSLYLIGGPQWIDQHLPSTWTESRQIKFVISFVKKLFVFVAIPFAIFRFFFGYRLRDFGIQRAGLRALCGGHLPVVLAVGAAFLAFQYFVRGGGGAFRREHFSAFQLLVGLPLCFMWLLLEVGLVEEFFFRSLVQSQLAATFKSEVSGIVLMSLIFGLAHAPGFIFRHAGELEGLGPNPSALDSIAYSIVVLAVSGITFGVIWARTKNLFALMLVHAAGDLLPNFGSFVRTWF